MKFATCSFRLRNKFFIGGSSHQPAHATNQASMSAPSATPSATVSPPTGSNQSLLLKSSPSYLWSNLSSSGSYLAYTHISEVHIISEVALTGKKVTSKKIQSKDGSTINHARWTKIAQKHYLVLATSSGVQVCFAQMCLPSHVHS